MSLVTFGGTTKELEAFLGLTDAVNPATADGLRLVMLLSAAEAFVRRKTSRTFAETSYVSILDSEDERFVKLEDWPITGFTSLESIDSWDTSGNPDSVTTITRDRFYVDTEKGILAALGTYAFPEGRKRLRVTYDAGFTAAELAPADITVAPDDVQVLKQLILSLVAREYGLSKDTKRHLSNITFGDQSATYLFNLDKMQERWLQHLTTRPGEKRRWPRLQR